MPTKKQSRRHDLVVQLRFGYEVNLSDPEGLTHLCNAICGETFRVGKALDLLEKIGIEGVYRECQMELQYVAGQLKAMGSSIGLDRLTDWFGSHWDRVIQRALEKRLQEKRPDEGKE